MHISDNNQTPLTGEVSAISIGGIQAAKKSQLIDYQSDDALTWVLLQRGHRGLGAAV